MIMKLIVGCILLAYMLLSLFAYIGGKKVTRTFIKTLLYFINCILVIISVLGLFLNDMRGIVPLIIGLVGMSACTIHNGYELHGTPNWKHHIVRGIFTICLFAVYGFIVYKY